MLMSMTGFATKTLLLPIDQEKAPLTISIKSLNSRFFESTFKLPYALAHLETDIMQLCKSRLKRGHVFFTIALGNPNLFKSTAEPSMSVVQGYLDAINTIKKVHKITGDITVAELIQLPNIFSVEEKSIDEKAKELILAATQEVLDVLLEQRKKEGIAIQKDVDQRITVLTKEIQDIETISERLMQEHKETVGARMQELGTATGEAAEAQRLTLYGELDKMDINEEIVRFKSHLHNIKSIVQSPDVEKGKRIDFTLQELIREINTIAAKCADVAMGALVINGKVELEKIREQSQNIV